MVKSMTSERLKFAISGISDDLDELIEDHGSIGRLIEQGYAHVLPMNENEVFDIFKTAEILF